MSMSTIKIWIRFYSVSAFKFYDLQELFILMSSTTHNYQAKNVSEIVGAYY